MCVMSLKKMLIAAGFNDINNNQSIIIMMNVKIDNNNKIFLLIIITTTSNYNNVCNNNKVHEILCGLVSLLYFLQNIGNNRDCAAGSP